MPDPAQYQFLANLGVNTIAMFGTWMPVVQKSVAKRVEERLDALFSELASTGMTLEQLETLLATDEQLQDIIRRVANATAYSPDPEKREALKRIAVKALAGTDDAEVDELPLLTGAIEAISAPEMRVMAALHKLEEDLRLEQVEFPETLMARAAAAPGVKNPNGGLNMDAVFAAAAIQSVLGDRVPVIDAVLARLEREGLVTTQVQPGQILQVRGTARLTPWGRRVWSFIFLGE